jgi:hypothetical protein
MQFFSDEMALFVNLRIDVSTVFNKDDPFAGIKQKSNGNNFMSAILFTAVSFVWITLIHAHQFTASSYFHESHGLQ